MVPVGPKLQPHSRSHRRVGSALTAVLAGVALASVGLLGLAVWTMSGGEEPASLLPERGADARIATGSASLAPGSDQGPARGPEGRREGHPGDSTPGLSDALASRAQAASSTPDRPGPRADSGSVAGSADTDLSAGSASREKIRPQWGERPARPGTVGAAMEALQAQKEAAGLTDDPSADDGPPQTADSPGYIEIQSVWAGTDAEAAGIRPGDRITRIGDVEIRGPSDMARVMQLKGNVTVYGIDSTGKPWTIPDVPGPVCCMFFHKPR